MSIFERIKQTAKQRGLTLTQVSEKAHLGEKTLYKWKKTEPGAERLKSVADVLGVSVDYLLGTTDDPNPKTDSDAEPLTDNQKLIAYSIDPDISDDERRAIIELVQQAMKLRRRL